MLTKKEYAEIIAKEVNGTVETFEKTNGIIMTAVLVPTLKSGVNAAIYIDQYYDQEIEPEDAAAKVKESAENSNNPTFDIDFISQYELVKPYLRARLYNKATKVEVYKSAADYGFSDLIITPYIVFDLGNGSSGGIKVSNSLLKKWNVTADEVLTMAEDNSKAEAEIMDMAKMLGIPDFMTPGEPQMLVVTNTSKTCGAYAIIAKLEELKERFKDGFTVLPSSVHEVIVVNAKDDAFSDMVQSVNAEQLSPDEVLSDHAYTIAA